jgi:hypothetical protein
LESDYFIAKDDHSTSKGAEHINQKSFSASTLYRHIVLDIPTLRSNLGTSEESGEEDLKMLVANFAKACIESFPEGSKNSFYARTLPSYILIDHTSIPITMANAFESGIEASPGYETASIQALKDHRAKQMLKRYRVSNSFDSDDHKSFNGVEDFVKGAC